MISLPHRPGFGSLLACLRSDDVARAAALLGRQEGAEKALFHLACKLETLGFPAPLEGEHPVEWMGRYKALVEELVHMTAAEIERGQLNLQPLPRTRARG